ncbi:MAG: diaminopimelate decarboxylase [Firmicutes bacterium]|nr:diaminopimelate decarboxylase [Bacillota bacterium]
MRFFGTSRVNARGHLEIGGCDSVDLAREFGTPLYVFDEDLIRSNLRQYRQGFAEHYPGPARVAYAAKAFLTTAMAALASEEGTDMDAVSGGEIYTALRGGFPAERILFHGNNKTPEEVQFALEAGVGRFVADNLYELDLLEEAAARRRTRARVLLRVTPGIDAHTHDYIRTGQVDSKFGLVLENGQALAAVRETLRRRHLELVGLHSHIGSQVFDPEPFADSAQVMMRFLAEVRRETGLTLSELDLGGGLGVHYTEQDDPPTIGDFTRHLAAAMVAAAGEADYPLPTLYVEPGRSIVAEAGTTLYTVGSIKDIPGIRTYLAVDGGMGDNPRPALYGAQYEACVANRMGQQPNCTVAVAGKCCESGDMLIQEIALSEPQPGDLLAVTTTGAYNHSMASNYNRLGRPAAIFVRGGRADLVVRRETYEDLVALDVLPSRLSAQVGVA